MAEFALETARDRKLTVKVDGGEIYLRVAKYNGISEYGFEQAYLSPHLAVQIAHALLNVAEGKEAGASRPGGADVRLLEQRVSALEEQMTSVASRITEFTVNEPEQKFYLKLTEADYVNWDTYFYDGTIKITDKVQTEDYKTQFTQAEIDSNPELKKFEAFKIPVPADELAE